MSTLNELKYAALLGAGAVGSTINELEYNWLKDVQGRSGTLNEMWVQEFLAAGATKNAWNSMAYQYLGLNGIFANTLNERWYRFWLVGGLVNPNLVTNGDFVTDSDWVKGTGWTIAGGKACCDGSQVAVSNLSQNVTYVIGTEYRLRYTILNYTAGGVRPTAAGVPLIQTSGNGTVVEKFIAVSTSGLAFEATVTPDFIGCIENVSVRKVDPVEVQAVDGTLLTYTDDEQAEFV